MHKRLFSIILLCMLGACSSYYRKNIEFNRLFQSGDIEKAASVLKSGKKAETNRTRFLYFVNLGVIKHLQQDYTSSNLYFEKAHLYTEDYIKKRTNQVASFLTNPTVTDYYPEDHEVVLVNYYKALNFIFLADYEAALVETRRLNIKLNALSDKYKNENKYKEDAYAHLLMGIIYDINREYNNAFIAYRNAYNIYQNSYSKDFGVHAPEQLKRDLLRTAALNNFYDDLRFYENNFGIKYQASAANTGSMIFLWHNGLGPVKEEWSINFSMVKGAGGVMNFTNQDMGLNFSFPASSSNSNNSDFSNLSFLRVAFPKYIERMPMYSNANIQIDNQQIKLEKAQDINQIAFKSLNDRMMLEMSKSLVRLAAKKASEYAVRQKNENLGSLVGIVNAATEKADTRNWQTLPHSIFYGRIDLPEGNHLVELKPIVNGNRQSKTNKIEVDVQKGRTTLKTFHSLEYRPTAHTEGMTNPGLY